ncbi:hypothetical protein [Archangium violaceum]|uniref:hypothetical protein n=1 Tax=Archangium violaceum TaxID=83451 RepID=UPI001363EC14|nr:hypothetical protein [Archangium violaceum]
MTTSESKKQKRPYRRPVIRSERILVANLFASKDPGQGCAPFCPPGAESSPDGD